MCRLCEVLYLLLPFPAARGWLLRMHMADCPRCGRDLALKAPVVRALAEVPSWIKREASLWPRVRADILMSPSRPEPKETRTGRPDSIRWRFAVAVLSLALCIAANLLIRQGLTVSYPPGMTAAAPAGVTVNFAEVQGKKARHHIFQTSSRSYVWFVQSKDDGGE